MGGRPEEVVDRRGVDRRGRGGHQRGRRPEVVARTRRRHRRQAGRRARRAGGRAGSHRGRERFGEGPGGGEAALALLGQRAQHGGLERQVLRERRHPLLERRGRGGQVQADDLLQVARDEGRRAGEQFVGHAAHGIDVGAHVELVGQRLLGREVGRRADHDAHSGQLLAGLVGALGVAQPRDAEVENLHHLGPVAPLAADEVGGLQVAVNDAQRVRFRQAGAHLHQQVDRAQGVDGATPDFHVERLPFDVLHGQVGLATGGAAEVEDPHHVRALELTDQLGLALEAGPHVGVGGELGAQQLERDRALQVNVVGAVHLAHAAGGQVGLDAEALVDGGARLEQRLLDRIARPARRRRVEPPQGARLVQARGAEDGGRIGLRELGVGAVEFLRRFVCQRDQHADVAALVEVWRGDPPGKGQRGAVAHREVDDHLAPVLELVGPGHEAVGLAATKLRAEVFDRVERDGAACWFGDSFDHGSGERRRLACVRAWRGPQPLRERLLRPWRPC